MNNKIEGRVLKIKKIDNKPTEEKIKIGEISKVNAIVRVEEIRASLSSNIDTPKVI